MAIRLEKSLFKIAGQIRYKPTFKSWENIIRTAESLQATYPNWTFEAQGDINLSNPDDRKAIRVAYNQVIYTKEKRDPTFLELQKHLSESFKGISKDTGINSFLHFGCRSVNVYKCNLSYSELVQIFYEKFYRQDPDLKAISGEKIMDVMFSQKGNQNSILNSVLIGPQSKKEFERILNKSFTYGIPVGKEEDIEHDCFVLFDIDTFLKEEEANTAIEEKTEKLLSENQRIHDKYFEYLTS